MYSTIEEYREYLEGLCYEHLLGEDRLEAMAQDAIEARFDGLRRELESMNYDEIICPHCLDELVEIEIARRLEEFEEEDD